MTISIVDESQRKAARVAGFTFLFAMASVVLANYGINFRLIVPGNAVDTARNILAHETLFRVNIACNLIYVVTIVALLSALYVILKPVNRNLALVAAFCRLVFALMWGITALNTLGALRLLGDAAYLPVFKADQLQTLARLHLASSWDAYYVGLPFWGLASTVCSYLWFKSRYIPRALAAFGVISSAWCVICAFAFIVFPHFDATVNASWFDVPMVIFEIALGLWLLFKGLSPSGLAGPDKASDRAHDYSKIAPEGKRAERPDRSAHFRISEPDPARRLCSGVWPLFPGPCPQLIDDLCRDPIDIVRADGGISDLSFDQFVERIFSLERRNQLDGSPGLEEQESSVRGDRGDAAASFGIDLSSQIDEIAPSVVPVPERHVVVQWASDGIGPPMDGLYEVASVGGDVSVVIFLGNVDGSRQYLEFLVSSVDEPGPANIFGSVGNPLEI